MSRVVPYFYSWNIPSLPYSCRRHTSLQRQL
ncbi:hypothetical protein Ga0076813_13371, partial [endosymbiont of Ridgeia piscesae]